MSVTGKHSTTAPGSGLRLRDDGFDIVASQDGNHAPILSHGLDAVRPARRQFNGIHAHYLEPLVAKLHIVQGTGDDHPAPVDNSNMIGDQLDLDELVRRKEHGSFRRGGDSDQLAQHVFRGGGVKAIGWLIQDQQLGSA